ncbi:MAG: hypothetical protein ACPL7A_02865, partial [Anaerolineales bacterium]
MQNFGKNQNNQKIFSKKYPKEYPLLFWALLSIFLFSCRANSNFYAEIPPTEIPVHSPSSQTTQSPTPFSENIPFTITPSELPPTATPTDTPQPSIHFAVIGDYGSGDQNEANVAKLVKSWNPDFIITTGDNNYPIGSEATIDYNIGQFYH